jgi:hypothetical protein
LRAPTLKLAFSLLYVLDMDGNGIVNIVDVAKVAREFGKKA